MTADRAKSQGVGLRDPALGVLGQKQGNKIAIWAEAWTHANKKRVKDSLFDHEKQ